MHALLLGALFWGVQWQRRTPEPVSVELVRALPPAPLPQAKPVPEVKPQPPKPVEVKAPEPKPVVKPDIALKEPEKKKPKETPKPNPPVTTQSKTPARDKPPEPVRDRTAELMNASLASATAAAEKARQAEMLNAAGKNANAAANIAAMGKASKDWSDRIAAKIKPNISKPAGLSGNPVVEFEVDLIPGSTGASLIGDPKLVKSSGNPTLDEAVKRGILKSDPLPMPLKTDVFERRVRLVFKPMEE